MEDKLIEAIKTTLTKYGVNDEELQKSFISDLEIEVGGGEKEDDKDDKDDKEDVKPEEETKKVEEEPKQEKVSFKKEDKFKIKLDEKKEDNA